jgi:hypothetical protein
VKLSRVALLGLTVFLFSGCYGPDPNVTPAGGLPVLSLDLADPVTAGSIEPVTLTIENPGPEDMDSVVVAFSRLGDPDLPLPLVDVAARGKEGPVVDVSPSPNGTSPDRVVYTFDGIDEGDSLTLEFRVRIPETPGFYGNAVQVYEGSHPDRARGVRLETHVRR